MMIQNGTVLKLQTFQNSFNRQLTTSHQKHETFYACKIITTPKGEKVIDFGQNLVGWVQLKSKRQNRRQCKIFHAEVLDKEGNFYTENLRGAKKPFIF